MARPVQFRSASLMPILSLAFALLTLLVVGETAYADDLSVVAPSSVDVSVERLGQMEQAIRAGDFKAITSVLIARHESLRMNITSIAMALTDSGTPDPLPRRSPAC